MVNKNITVFGRLKPSLYNRQEYLIEKEETADCLEFTDQRFVASRKKYRSGKTWAAKFQSLFSRFKKIFKPEGTNQEDIFREVARPIIDNVLSGYNGTIFAYGQTGSGKTFTITGDIKCPIFRGIIPRTLEKIFREKTDATKIGISYFEIYNEHGYDLIGYEEVDELPQVNVLEDSTGTLHFRNLSVHDVQTEREALELLTIGDSNRVVSQTVSNFNSSRSHSVFTISLETERDAIYYRSKLHLVDLAGSERWSKTKNAMPNIWETRNINLSLHYLEQVMVALGQPNRIHIPYRNSLMTAVLKDSLGGNCTTTMIATMSIEPDDFEETLQTCRFAQRVAMVKNDARVNEIVDADRELGLLRIENDQLKAQMKLLTHQVTFELTEEDRRECRDRVNKYIKDNDSTHLPFDNVKMCEYCFQLLRVDLLQLRNQQGETEPEKPRGYIPSAQVTFPRIPETPHLLETFEPPERRMLHSMYPIIATSQVKKERLFRKRSIMKLPKVNVVYKRWKSTLAGDGEEVALTEKIHPVEAKVDNLYPNYPERIPSTHYMTPEYSEKPEKLIETEDEMIMRDLHVSFEDEKKPPKVERIEPLENTYKPARNVPSEQYIDQYVDVVPKVTASRAKEELRMGMHEKEQDEEDEDEKFSRFSTSSLLLTGDADIDDEIIKFYKARYRCFNS